MTQMLLLLRSFFYYRAGQLDFPDRSRDLRYVSHALESAPIQITPAELGDGKRPRSTLVGRGQTVCSGNSDGNELFVEVDMVLFFAGKKIMNESTRSRYYNAFLSALFSCFVWKERRKTESCRVKDTAQTIK